MCANPSGRTCTTMRYRPAGRPLRLRSAAALQRLVVERVEQRGAVDVDVAELARVDVLDGAPARSTAGTVLTPRLGGLRGATLAALILALAALAAALAATTTAAAPAALLGRTVGPDSVVVAAPRPAGSGQPWPRPKARAGSRRSWAGVRVRAATSPASSRACSPMSSSVRPRSAVGVGPVLAARHRLACSRIRATAIRATRSRARNRARRRPRLRRPGRHRRHDQCRSGAVRAGTASCAAGRRACRGGASCAGVRRDRAAVCLRPEPGRRSRPRRRS